MPATSTPAAATAAAKREVREALAFAGFQAEVLASKTHITIDLADAADRPALLQMYPDATPCDYNPRKVYLVR